MAQLVDRVRQVKCLEVEKARSNKCHKNEKVAYVKIDEIDKIYDVDCVEKGEVNLAELKPRSPYICKLLRPSNRRNLVEPRKN